MRPFAASLSNPGIYLLFGALLMMTSSLLAGQAFTASPSTPLTGSRFRWLNTVARSSF